MPNWCCFSGRIQSRETLKRFFYFFFETLIEHYFYIYYKKCSVFRILWWHKIIALFKIVFLLFLSVFYLSADLKHYFYGFKRMIKLLMKIVSLKKLNIKGIILRQTPFQFQSNAVYLKSKTFNLFRKKYLIHN